MYSEVSALVAGQRLSPQVLIRYDRFSCLSRPVLLLGAVRRSRDGHRQQSPIQQGGDQCLTEFRAVGTLQWGHEFSQWLRGDTCLENRDLVPT